MVTWITVEDGRIGRIRQTRGDGQPGPEWEKVPDGWGGSPGDKLAWFDGNMRRIPDAELVRTGLRKDNRGTWFSKEKPGERKTVYGFDEEPGEGWTRKAPMENEPCRKWDEAGGSWVADTGVKEEAEKERRISEKKSVIQDAERRIQRSLIARAAGTATDEDERYFARISAEIALLREELERLAAA
jgi:hypothetical protein